MNKKIRQLAEQAGITSNNLSDGDMSYNDLEKFAELFIRECADFLSLNSRDGHEDGKRLKRHFGVEE